MLVMTIIQKMIVIMMMLIIRIMVIIMMIILIMTIIMMMMIMMIMMKMMKGKSPALFNGGMLLAYIIHMYLFYVKFHRTGCPKKWTKP